MLKQGYIFFQKIWFHATAPFFHLNSSHGYQRLKINQTSLKNEKLFWFVPLKFQISKKCKKCANFQKNVFICACFITLIAILILILKWLFGFQWSGRPENLNCLHICKIWWINATAKKRACVKIIYLWFISLLCILVIRARQFSNARLQLLRL